MILTALLVLNPLPEYKKSYFSYIVCMYMCMYVCSPHHQMNGRILFIFSKEFIICRSVPGGYEYSNSKHRDPTTD
jgi:hypothetical protein